MKKLIIHYILLLLLLTLPGTLRFSFAENIIKTATSEEKIKQTNEEIPSSKIEELKERIATRVAEIIKKSPKIKAGFIKEIKEGEIIIENKKDKSTTSVKIDENIIKIFDVQKGSKIEKKQKDLEKNMYVLITGYPLESEFLAQNIFIQLPYVEIAGQILGIDKENYTIEVLAFDKKEYTIDIETSTLQQMISHDLTKIQKIGFSKLKVNDKIHILALKSQKTERYSAVRLLIIPQELLI